MVKGTRVDLFGTAREQWLINAKHTARKLLEVHEKVTIEDVLDKCPLPRYLHKNTIGRVFNNREFKSVGYVPSRRTRSKGRIIQQWTLREGIHV